MRRWVLLSVVLIAVMLLISAQTAEPDEQPQALKSGETVTKALTTVTSTAISPLLGVSVMGAWQYFKTDSAAARAVAVLRAPVLLGAGHGAAGSHLHQRHLRRIRAAHQEATGCN